MTRTTAPAAETGRRVNEVLLCFPVALLVTLAAGAALGVAAQGTDEIGADLKGVDCGGTAEVQDVLDFLSRGGGNGSGLVAKGNSSAAVDGLGGGASEWTLADLCGLGGVVCLEQCTEQFGRTLLEPLCTLGNGTLGPEVSWSDDEDLASLLGGSTSPALALVSYCVTQLNFADRGWEGSLKSLRSLRNLEVLNLTKNAITGTVQDLSSMKKLEKLDLGYNRIEGNFSGFANPALKYFYGGNNLFRGTLAGLEGLRSLEVLDLSFNEIEGTMDSLETMSQLKNALLSHNQLTGSINVIQNMTELLVLNVVDNRLSGALPQFGVFDNVVVLSLSYNNFTRVGNALETMKNIQLLDLSANQFDDNINDVLSISSVWMGRMDLRVNNFRGVMNPDALQHLPNLEMFFVQDNPKLQGRLLPNFENFEQMLVSTNDQLIYYTVDEDFFRAIETTDSNYFQINTGFISLEPTCNEVHQSLAINENDDKEAEFYVEIPEEVDQIYFCFATPRGKFLIDPVTQTPLEFNVTFNANAVACGVPVQQQGQSKGGTTSGDGRFIPVALPVATCNKKDAENFINEAIRLSMYTVGQYADGSSRGKIQQFAFGINIQEDTSQPLGSGGKLAAYISMIVLFSVIAFVLAGFVWMTVAMYLSFQKSQKYSKMKKSAESAFVKSRKEARLQMDKDSCIVFTDIQNSTVLRDASSQLYNEIILVHDGIIRKLTAKLGGLELATEGDGFVLWFENVAHGTLFCMELQEELMQCSWDRKITKLCNKAYEESHDGASTRFASKGSMRSPHHSNHSNISFNSDAPTLYKRFQNKYFKLLFRAKKEKCFNGPRVRCGVHVIRSGMNTIENQALGVYSFSGPDFEIGRMVCDIGHGGQVLVTGQAQGIILENLNATQFPQIWHWGGYTFDDDEDKDIHHIYEIAPSHGVLKMRNFESLRGHIQLAYPPGVNITSRSLPLEDAIIVCATVKDPNMTKAAYDIADGLISDMQQRFWGWRVMPDDMVKTPTKPGGGRGKAFARLGRVSMRSTGQEELGASPTGEVISPASTGAFPSNNSVLEKAMPFRFQEVSFEEHEMSKRWFFAFAKPEDALRFALCCQLELVYANWPKSIKSRFKKQVTAEKAPLWQGLPVAFAIHVCKSPNFDQRRHLELMPISSFRMKPPSKKNLTLCNPSRRNILYTTRDTVRATMSILDSVALDGQVVVTTDLIQSMTLPIASVGDPVVEHLGRVAVKDFKSSVDVYQVLPVELAARRFPTLSEALSTGHLLSVGARCAPKPKVGLAFVFMYTVVSSETQDNEGNNAFSSDSIFDGDQLQVLLTRFSGYLVDEVSMSNMVFAFEDVSGAVCFCATIQKSLAIFKLRLKDSLWEEDGVQGDRSFELSEGAPQDAVDAVNLLKSNHDVNKTLKFGIASIETQAEVHDVYLGIDSTTGRRRYGTPVLNMAARVAKSARTGQILMVGRNPTKRFWDSRKVGELEDSVGGVQILQHGYYKLRGFGEKPRFIYEVRSSMVATCSLLDLSQADHVLNSDDIEAVSSQRSYLSGSEGALSIDKVASTARTGSRRKKRRDGGRGVRGGGR